jgi:UDP-3-O-[3-hydroxymyristoyl] glucosamine N-acyltransferase
MNMTSNEFNFADLQTAFPELIVEFSGAKIEKLNGVSSAEHSRPGSLIFCLKPQLFAAALQSKAAAIVVPKNFFLELKSPDKLIISSSNPELLMAKVIQKFILQTPYRDVNARHPSAFVDSTAIVHPSAILGANVVIGKNVKVGAGSYIGAGSVIESFSEIGESTTVQALVVIGTRVKIGSGCEISSHSIVGKEGFGYAHDAVGNHIRIPHQGWVVIEDDVHLGACNTIDRGTFGETRIGQGTKTDNQVHIAHNCRVGRGCLLTSGFKMAGSSSIGNFVIAGGNTLIGGHLTVADQVNLAAQSAVSKNIEKSGDYGGSPLLPLQEFLKMKSTLTKLPEMRKQLSLLTKKIFADDK